MSALDPGGRVEVMIGIHVEEERTPGTAGSSDSYGRHLC